MAANTTITTAASKKNNLNRRERRSSSEVRSGSRVAGRARDCRLRTRDVYYDVALDAMQPPPRLAAPKRDANDSPSSGSRRMAGESELTGDVDANRVR